MLRDVDTVSIVGHGDYAIVTDFELDPRYREGILFPRSHSLLLPNLMVSAVNGALVEQLVQPRDKFDLLGGYAILFCVLL